MMRYLFLISLTLWCGILLLWATPQSQADGCRVRSSYVAPTYHTPSYDYGHHYDYHPYAIPVYQEPHYEYQAYASVNSYYRDSILADAVVGRLLLLQQGGAAAAPGGRVRGGGDAAPAPTAPLASSSPISTAVSPKLQAFVDANCIRCHNGPKGKAGVDLSSLATSPLSVRLAFQVQIDEGTMPPVKDGEKPKPASDEEVQLAYDWVKASVKAARK